MKNNYIITAVGDIFIADQPLCFGFGVKSLHQRNYNMLIPQEIVNLFKDSTINLGNLESSYDSSNILKFGINDMCTDKKALKYLKKCNFNLLCLANNHTLDKGKINLFKLIKRLSDYSIEHIGLKDDIYIHQYNRKKIAYIGYNNIHNGYDNSLLNNWTDNSIDEIKILSKKSDFVVVVMHWGYEFMNQPSEEQVKIAHQLIDNGANLVIGHHPHVLQPIEQYKKGLIAYSLGNFLFDYTFFPPAALSEILQIKYDFETKKLTYSTYPIKITENYSLTLQAENQISKLSPKTAMSSEIVKKRNLYRKYALFHVIKNFHRYKDKIRIVKWITNRMVKYLINSKKEQNDPMEVYKWN